MQLNIKDIQIDMTSYLFDRITFKAINTLLHLLNYNNLLLYSIMSYCYTLL